MAQEYQQNGTTKSYQGYHWTPKWPKIAQNSIKSFFAVRSPPQELEEGPRSGPYLLVNLEWGNLGVVQLGAVQCSAVEEQGSSTSSCVVV